MKKEFDEGATFRGFIAEGWAPEIAQGGAEGAKRQHSQDQAYIAELEKQTDEAIKKYAACAEKLWPNLTAGSRSELR